MTPERMKHLLTNARHLVEDGGLQMVYFVAYDAQTKKYCAIAGESLGSKTRLEELRDYAIQQLAEMEKAVTSGQG